MDPVLERPSFTVAAVVLTDESGRVLTVRKRGTTMFMLPGGKIEPGETSNATAVREVREELGLVLDPAALRLVGAFVTETANEPGHLLRSDVYAYARPVVGERPASEIAEARWLNPARPTDLDAPLTHAVLARRRVDTSQL